VLPGAAAWVFRDGSVGQKSKYFQPREWEEQDRWSLSGITKNSGMSSRGTSLGTSMVVSESRCP